VSVDILWLGQATFRLSISGVEVLIDPWFSPHPDRLIPPPPLTVADDVDLLLITHEHLDHLDEEFLPVLAARSPGAHVVIPQCLVSRVEPHFGTVTGVVPGDTVVHGELTVDVVPAVHGVTMADAYGDGSSLGEGPRFVGYVLRGDPVVYHAGDTIPSPQVTSAFAGDRVDVALLPINGRDEERERAGLVGNLDAREAVELALLVNAHTLIPFHWDGFVGNTASPADAVSAADGRIDVLVPVRGHVVTLG
jgi:L-ascorbate metabolism protein UlaG (beta-lactamase superfamily)